MKNSLVVTSLIFLTLSLSGSSCQSKCEILAEHTLASKPILRFHSQETQAAAHKQLIDSCQTHLASSCQERDFKKMVGFGDSTDPTKLSEGSCRESYPHFRQISFEIEDHAFKDFQTSFQSKEDEAYQCKALAEMQITNTLLKYKRNLKPTVPQRLVNPHRESWINACIETRLPMHCKKEFLTLIQKLDRIQEKDLSAQCLNTLEPLMGKMKQAYEIAESDFKKEVEQQKARNKK